MRHGKQTLDIRLSSPGEENAIRNLESKRWPFDCHNSHETRKRICYVVEVLFGF
jgi:hypothetical protein